MRKPERARCAALACSPCRTDPPTDRRPGGRSLAGFCPLPPLRRPARVLPLPGAGRGVASSWCGTISRARRSPFAESTLGGSVKARKVPATKIAQAP